MVCHDKSLFGKKGNYTIVVCSGMTDASKVVSDYLNELKQLEYRAIDNVYQAFAKDLLGEPISKFTEKYLKSKMPKFEATLNKLHLGKVSKVLFDCYSYYTNYKNLYSQLDRVDYSGAQKLLNSVIISDDTVTDKAVKKAVNVLSKAQSKLNTALMEYISTGEVTPPKKGFLDGFLSILKCPISVEIYKGNAQIGYVGEDDTWFNNDIFIDELGGAKLIYSRAGDEISFVITGLESGTMDYTIEQYVNGVPTGRLNFYDIPLDTGTSYQTVIPAADLDKKRETFVLTSKINSIFVY